MTFDIEAWMWVVWLIIFIAALIIESLGPEVISIWFAGGSLVTLIVSFIPGVAWWIETVVFAVVSIGLLIFLRPILTKLIKRDTVPLNADAMSGKLGIVKAGITPLKSGEVEIDGVIWTAISTKEGDIIEEGTEIKVLSISGNKLIVTPIN